MSNGAQRRPTDLADSLGNCIPDGENLVRLLVQKQVIVTEVWTGNMPMEILRLDVERVNVGQRQVHCARDVSHRSRVETGRCLQSGGATFLDVLHIHIAAPSLGKISLI